MSFHVDRDAISVGPRGEVAHRDAIDHSLRFGRKLYAITDGVWCYVGGGMSNITFVDAPEGLIAIDSGDNVEEAAEALAAVREHTDRPVVSVIWSHFHYVQGTTAYLEGDDRPIEIVAHEDSERLLRDMGAEVGPVRLRGLVSQMGIVLPGDGPDAMPNTGLGPFWKDPDRPVTTPGYLAPNRTIAGAGTYRVAGRDVVLTPIASDSEDTLVIWFPDLAVCVNNHLWPVLFNVFPLRGEPYRDPLVRLTAFDLMLEYEPEFLLGVHGPPIVGRDAVAAALRDYRDAIQFLWDQTVRGMNAGLTLGELVDFVKLPERFSENYYTREFYGMVPHHVRQIHGGVRGWFDGDAVNLFPLSPADEAQRLVAGFGGREAVLAQAQEALAADDVSWAVQLATWLLTVDHGDAEAATVKANGLRLIAQSVTAANVRSWCLTQAGELEGSLSLDRFRKHHTSKGRVLGAPADQYVKALKVQLDPAAAADLELCVAWNFDDGTQTSLRIRRGVAVPGTETGGPDGTADTVLALSLATWAGLYSGEVDAATAIATGDLTISGDRAALPIFFAAFDHPHLSVAF